MNIFEISDEVFQVQEALYRIHLELVDAGGEVSEDLESRYDAAMSTLTGLKSKFEDKIAAYQFMIRQANSQAAGCKIEEERYRRRRIAAENFSARLKETAGMQMEALGFTEIGVKNCIRSNGGNVYWQKNSVFSVEPLPPLDRLPPDLVVRHDPTVDKAALALFVKSQRKEEVAEVGEHEVTVLVDNIEVTTKVIRGKHLRGMK